MLRDHFADAIAIMLETSTDRPVPVELVPGDIVSQWRDELCRGQFRLAPPKRRDVPACVLILGAARFLATAEGPEDRRVAVKTLRRAIAEIERNSRGFAVIEDRIANG